MMFTPIMPAVLLILIGAGLMSWCVVAGRRAGERRIWLTISRMVLIGATITAALRPAVGDAAVMQAQTSVDVLFVIDASTSMAGDDFGDGKTRIDGVREDVMSLASQHAGARFSVIAFDNRAWQPLPFTTDTSALKSAVSVLKPQPSLNASGSSISAPVQLMQDVLEDAAENSPERVRVVYYLGDGEQTASDKPASFAQIAQELGGASVLGYGTEAGGKMEEPDLYGTGDSSYVTDPKTGEPAITKIDTDALTKIAGELNGTYQHRSAGDEPAAMSVDATSTVVDPELTARTAFPLYWIFALIALAMLFVELWQLMRARAQLRHGAKGVEE